MANFLSGLGQGMGTILGGPGNAGAASSNAWNYGQYSPFTINNPMGSIGWNGQTGTASLSGPAQGLQTGLYGQANTGMGMAGGYNPNTSFLPQQYQQIFNPASFNQGVNNQFQNSVNGIMPFLQQAGASNLDNEFSKGTLASTAGQYQTAGFNQGLGATLSGLHNQAFQNQLGLSNSQFGAAQGTAGLGEQQQQFGALQGLGLLNSSLSGIGQQNSFMNQLMQTAGNLGAQRSGANVAAATPGIETGMVQDNATAGLLSGLLFGGGTTGGLLTSLLGGGQGGGGGGILGGLGSLGSAAGRGLSGLFGGSGGGSSGGGYSNPGTGGTGWAGDTQSTFDNIGGGGTGQTDYGIGTTTTFGSSNDNWWGDNGSGGSFNGAGGQAANLGDSVNTLPSVQNAVNQAPSQSNPFGSLGGYISSAGGIASGISKGGVEGGVQAAGNAGKLYNQVTGNSGGFAGLMGQAGQALNIYNGLTSGTPQGVVSGVASGAGLAASSGAASALGASAGTTAALGAAATGIGAVAAIPAVVQGVGGLLFDNILGMDKPDKFDNELGILAQKGGLTGSVDQNFAGQHTFGMGSQPTYYWNGKTIDPEKIMDPSIVQKASDFLLQGNTSGYNSLMNTLVYTPKNTMPTPPPPKSPWGI